MAKRLKEHQIQEQEDDIPRDRKKGKVKKFKDKGNKKEKI